jgi:RHS repeat-associated protein
MVQDGLGSVRGVVDNTVGVLESRNYDPYGVGFGATGSIQTSYGFTGEPMDDNGLLYLRARYYNPAAGVFTALDPFEGMWDDPMSINGYSYVHGDPTNLTDPSGECPWCVAAIPVVGVVVLVVGAVLLLDAINKANRNESLIEAGGEALEKVWNNVCVPAFEAVVTVLGEGFKYGYPGTITGADPVSQMTRVQSQTLDQPLTVPYTQRIPNNYKGAFDVALGIGTTLTSFAASFTDRATVPFGLWP